MCEYQNADSAGNSNALHNCRCVHQNTDSQKSSLVANYDKQNLVIWVLECTRQHDMEQEPAANGHGLSLKHHS